MRVAARHLARSPRRRAALAVAPPPITECDHPLLLQVYRAADRAEGDERRALLTLAAQVKRAALRELPPAERQRVLIAAEQRLGVLL